MSVVSGPVSDMIHRSADETFVVSVAFGILALATGEAFLFLF